MCISHGGLEELSSAVEPASEEDRVRRHWKVDATQSPSAQNMEVWPDTKQG